MTLDQLLRSGKPITVLLEALSSAGPHYVSNVGYIASPTDPVAPNRSYPDWLVTVPEVRQSLPDGLFGRSAIGWSEAVISNPNGVRDAWLDDAWDGRAVRILVGDTSWSLDQFQAVFIGVATGLQTTPEGALRLEMSDPREQLNRPVQAALLTTGARVGEPVPLCFGTVFNIEPVLIDPVLHTYRVHESAVAGIDEVYVGGLPVSYTSHPDGTFSLNVFPAGRVTCDVRGGVIGGVAIHRADQLLRHFAERVGVTQFDDGSLATLATFAPQSLGVYLPDRANAIDVLDQVAASVGAWWGFDGLGKITAAVAQPGVPVLTLIPDDSAQFSLQIDRIDPPNWRRRIGYRRNYAVQTDGLFAAVDESVRARLGREWDVAEASAPSTRTLHPLATDPDLEPTFLVLGYESRAEAARRLALFGVPAKRVRMSAFARAWALRPGQTVRVIHPRFGLALGRDCLVTEVRRRVSSRTTELLLWAGGTFVAGTPTVLATETGQAVATESGELIDIQESA